jgi:hypothetical protein
MAFPVYPALVRRQVLGQHAELRAFLVRVLGETRAPPEDSASRAQLGSTVRTLRERFKAHLAFEDEALLPVLAVVPSFGPARVKEKVAEHARQRRDLDTLVAGLDSGWGMERLALVTRSLVMDLILDMAEEERLCLHGTELGDDVLVPAASFPAP